MSDAIKHECGIAMVRLRKPLNFYKEKYGTAFYALNKMYLLMEKQHNRGQDGAGIANIKLDVEPGKRYISRKRSIDQQPIQEIFKSIHTTIEDRSGGDTELINNPDWLKENTPFSGEIFLGHLRYGTYGKNSIEACHPFLRQNNWMTRNLILAGNFNMTNVDELFNQLVDLGQHPKEKVDTVTVMEKIGHFLDEANEELYAKFKNEGLNKRDISGKIAAALNIPEILRNASKKWDGGYAMAGMFGHGDSFVLRDPNGIRPAFYYIDDEVLVVASERPVIQTAFNVPIDEIKEVPRGNALIIKKDGSYGLHEIIEPGENKACSFERIYFSRGNDKDIYAERLELGRRLTKRVLKAVDYDTRNTVISFIPNTAEISFHGLVDGMEEHLNDKKKDAILSGGYNLTAAKVRDILGESLRVEKITWKDVKLRTFISSDSGRDDLVSHVYDTTYGIVKPTDNLVVIDDSIVRGTTLKKSILRILDRLNPMKIVVVSSAPQIRYPDCYGIDMAKLQDFVAFRAAIELLKDHGKEGIIDEVYKKAKAQVGLDDTEIKNFVKEIYDPFTADEVSDKIAEMLKPADMGADLEIIFQSIFTLHEACPNHPGDWYFTGDFPTPGGNRVVNKAFINYVEGRDERAY